MPICNTPPVIEVAATIIDEDAVGDASGDGIPTIVAVIAPEAATVVAPVTAAPTAVVSSQTQLGAFRLPRGGRVYRIRAEF